mmetsp:Transcript_27822/g.28069  ORF Transcript_27822/g.28069 Transcript_27822/m.28069 type:complete len:126 (-) Transcript_27822:162-539(-)
MSKTFDIGIIRFSDIGALGYFPSDIILALMIIVTIGFGIGFLLDEASRRNAQTASKVQVKVEKVSTPSKAASADPSSESLDNIKTPSIATPTKNSTPEPEILGLIKSPEGIRSARRRREPERLAM